MNAEENFLKNAPISDIDDSSEEGDNAAEKEESKMKEIEQTGSVTTAKDGFSVQCISIIGQVEGHYLLPSGQKTTKYEHILPMLVSAEEDEKTDGLLVILNTVGGDVEAGLAIAEMISTMKKPSVSLVLGGGHSIGVPLAVSAKRSFIVPSATMTLHPVRFSGTVIGAPQTYYYLDRIQDRIIDFISRNSRMKPDRLRELIMVTDEIAADIGSILDGKRAVEEGLIDEIGGVREALLALRALAGGEDVKNTEKKV